MNDEVLTLEQFLASGLMEKKLADLKPGDKLSVLPEYGAGSVEVRALHFGRDGAVDGVVTDRGIFHKDSFVGVSESFVNEATKYPELDKIAKELTKLVLDEINKRTKDVKSDMPYKSQHVLEELIKKLEAAV